MLQKQGTQHHLHGFMCKAGETCRSAWQVICAFCKWTSLATESRLDRQAAVTPDFKFIACSRALFIAGIFFCCFAGLTCHVYKLQVVNHEHYNRAALRSTRKTITSVGTRGKIYDYEGNTLVGNLTGQRICAEPKRFKQEELEPIASLMATDLGLDRDKLLQAFRRVRNARVEVVIDCDLTRDNANVISNWNLTPVSVIPPELPGESPQLKIIPKSCSPEELDGILEQLAPIINVPRKQLRARIDKALNRPVEIPIANNVDFKAAQTFKKHLAQLETALAKQQKVKRRKLFIRISPRDTRYYPQGELLINVLGYLTASDRGASGIEQLFNQEMTPKNGKITFPKDSNGRRLGLKDFVTTPPQNGMDIILTVRAPIQKIAEEELDRAVKKYNPERAYAVMMNPKTGAIMAMAQYPSFNPYDRSGTTTDDMQNHCISEVYEPGSVMKPLPIAYAIDRGLVTLDSKVFCENGHWLYEGKVLHDTHRNQILTVKDILRVSSNIGTAKIAIAMTAPVLYNAFKAFGLGERTHVGFIPEEGKRKSLRPESVGQLKALEMWDRLSITRYPIGQGISVTPLQLVQAYATIANNGVMMQPYIIDRIIARGRDRAEEREIRSVPTVKGRPISPRAARDVTEALVAVVNDRHGTGRRAAMEEYTVAGKTGTGQIWRDNHYAAKYFTSSFIGFVPAHNPELVLIVTAKGVKVHGGTVGGPVFKAIAKRTLDYLGVQPEVPQQPENATTQLQAMP